MEKRELAFAKELSSILSPLGLARLEYITSEFEPFSAQERPDIVFTPSNGAYANTTIFIEIRFPRNASILRGSLIQLPERRDFVSDALNARLSKYVCITNVEVPEFSKALLLKTRISVIDKISDPANAAAELVRILLLS